MLQSITFQNFKSYRSATLKLAPLTMLIGANASGKSNAVEGLRLLSWIAQGNRLDTIRSTVHREDGLIRGRVEDLVYRGETEFGFRCHGAFDEATGSPMPWTDFDIRFRSTAEGEIRIVRERLTSDACEDPLYAAHGTDADDGTLTVHQETFTEGLATRSSSAIDRQAVFAQLESPARYPDPHGAIASVTTAVARRLRTSLGGVHIIDPVPSRMRGYVPTYEKRLEENAGNLSGVLYGLSEEPEVAAAILEIVRSLPEQDIKAIEFARTDRDEVMLRLTETFGGVNQTFDAPVLSDGTLRVLALAAALWSAPKGSLVVLEEVDNGIHPSRAADLLARIADVAETRSLHVLISSHNPALLDALPDSAIGDVIFCHREPESGASQLVRLADLPHYPELVAQGPIGALMTRGLIDRFVKHRPVGEDRVARAFEWLAALERDRGAAE